MCPKPFYGKKIKENFFSVGKTRGPLLARAALKRAFNVFFAFFFVFVVFIVVVFLSTEARGSY